ncbi:MAG: FAD-dependent oxidoreductase, partial [Clostridia bacterium]|nr:FAD-dependent oxidoreductase [Clostridia bacterium]
PGVSARMTEKFASCGGKLVTGVRATGIVLKHGRAEAVLTDRGEAFAADRVIAACDPHLTFSRLLPEGYAPAALGRIDDDPRTPHISSLHVALSMPDPLPPGAAWTTVIGGDPAAFPKRTGGRLILRSFVHEPGFAPAGRTAMQATCFLSGADAAEWLTRGAEYERKKAALSSAVLDAVTRAFPYSSPEVIDAWTPATYLRYTGADKGDYIGWLVPAGMIPPRLPERVRGIPNLSIASGWCRMPGGLPTAARSGVRAAADAMAADPLPRRFPGFSILGGRKAKKRQKFDLPS